MLKTVYGDIVNDNYDIFCHQVNCRGAMGSGLSVQIRKKYPEVYEAYRQNYACHIENPKMQLGDILLVNTSDGRICVNMYAQNYYGRWNQHTEYQAFAQCILALVDAVGKMDSSLKIAFPHRIGCGLGGGEWSIIERMISSFADRVKQDVYIVKLKGY